MQNPSYAGLAPLDKFYLQAKFKMTAKAIRRTPPVKAVKQGTNCIIVLCDDTDMFAILLHFYVQEKLTCQLFMEETNAMRTSFDIATTAMKHLEVILYPLAAHFSSDCDGTDYMYGIGKLLFSKFCTMDMS